MESTNLIHLKFAAPSKTLYDGKITKISLKTSNGQIMVLPNHEPFISDLEISHVRFYDTNNTEKLYAIAGGYVVFDQNYLYILSAVVDSKYDIDKETVLAAKARIEEKIAQTTKGTSEYEQLELAKKIAINRLSLK